MEWAKSAKFKKKTKPKSDFESTILHSSKRKAMKNALHLFNFFGPLISDCSKLFPFSEPFFALEAIPTLTFAL